MNRTLLLFDVDGTIAESSKKITHKTKNMISSLMKIGIHVGIVGGGKMDKIIDQLDGLTIHHYFSECGCVYYKTINTTDYTTNCIVRSSSSGSNPQYHNIQQIYIKNIREHILYPKINTLVKYALSFLSKVDYQISGHFVDLRNGIIYISLIGMNATNEERQIFMDLDAIHKFKLHLLSSLQHKAEELDIINNVEIVEGGSVGIAIYPKEYNKVQVLEHLASNYNEIHYFGDKYEKEGNDYQLLTHSGVIGHPVDTVSKTEQILTKLYTDAIFES